MNQEPEYESEEKTGNEPQVRSCLFAKTRLDRAFETSVGIFTLAGGIAFVVALAKTILSQSP
jgi:hypothetical protein